MSSIPSIVECLPGAVSALCSALCSAGANIPDTSDDLPEPETPVTAVIQPKGNVALIDCKLLCLAPLTLIFCLVGFLRLSGTGMICFPLRYAPVIDSGVFITSSGVPLATIMPPSRPAPGPRSQSQSA